MLTSWDPSATTMLARSWERDLGIELSTEDWEVIHTIIHIGSLNVSIQEHSSKLYTRWHRMPSSLHKKYPRSRALLALLYRRNTQLHIRWTCPNLQPFLSRVRNIISSIISYPLDFLPTQNFNTPRSWGTHTENT